MVGLVCFHAVIRLQKEELRTESTFIIVKRLNSTNKHLDRDYMFILLNICLMIYEEAISKNIYS